MTPERVVLGSSMKVAVGNLKGGQTPCALIVLCLLIGLDSLQHGQIAIALTMLIFCSGWDGFDVMTGWKANFSRRR
jgi:hypothetical protein